VFAGSKRKKQRKLSAFDTLRKSSCNCSSESFERSNFDKHAENWKKTRIITRRKTTKIMMKKTKHPLPARKLVSKPVPPRRARIRSPQSLSARKAKLEAVAGMMMTERIAPLCRYEARRRAHNLFTSRIYIYSLHQ
jgi:hypothetical protein